MSQRNIQIYHATFNAYGKLESFFYSEETLTHSFFCFSKHMTVHKTNIDLIKC